MLKGLYQKLFGTSNLPSHQGKTLLYIEDGKIDQKIVLKILDDKGLNIVLSETGKDGLTKAKELSPDLILLDYGLPDIDGNDVCKSLKANPATKDIPIIFLTGKDAPGTVIDCYEVGADYYLTKPVTARILLNNIDLMLNEKKVNR